MPKDLALNVCLNKNKIGGGGSNIRIYFPTFHFVQTEISEPRTVDARKVPKDDSYFLSSGGFLTILFMDENNYDIVPPPSSFKFHIFFSGKRVTKSASQVNVRKIGSFCRLTILSNFFPHPH
jgi:hypothetical protein